MKEWYDGFNHFLGLEAEPSHLTFLQISLRGVIVFFATLFIVRVADKRFLSKKTVFDAVVGFILASMMARAVNGSVSFFPTIGGAFVIVGLHRLLAHFAVRSHRLGIIIKGKPEQVISNGIIDHDILRRNNFSEHDLKEDLGMNGNVCDLSKVKEAHIERNGNISVVKR